MADPPTVSPLKAALTSAGLTTEQFADILGVDAKTVRRWIHGRVPYPRHRIAISHALDLPQHHLWPDLPETATHPQSAAEPSASTDSVIGYPDPEHPELPPLNDLIAAATRHIDIADATLLPAPPRPDPLFLLCTQLADPTLLALLTDRARAGVRIRVLVARVAADLAPLLDLPGVQLRSGGPDYTIHRGDGQLLLGLAGVTPNIEPRPVLHVHRRTTDGLFDRLLDSYEAEWEDAQPIVTATELDQLVSELEAQLEEDRRELEDHPDEDPADQPQPQSDPPPRRWPRRTQ